jgi:hypothetical protein
MAKNPPLPLPVKIVVRAINMGLAIVGLKLNVFISRL